ncbi:hypothetical protein H8356DRAFT_1346089 [Neocallimastix lanati (nom. inval.)]|nr:hypothetical protein H8356DRAFT_1346089 [Neocallimastix sp. JGI-2020a]
MSPGSIQPMTTFQVLLTRGFYRTWWLGLQYYSKYSKVAQVLSFNIFTRELTFGYMISFSYAEIFYWLVERLKEEKRRIFKIKRNNFAEEYEIDYERKRALEYTIKEKKKIKRADNVKTNYFVLFYNTNNTSRLSIDSKPSTEDINSLVKLKKQNKFSRCRGWDGDTEVTFINKKNMRFNKKLS